MKNESTVTILQGYDNRSVLYDTGDYVLRKVSPGYFSEIAGIYELYKERRLDQHGIVATEIDRSSSSLRHRKHTISYPYEWTANMFKDAVLFHLRLIEELDRHGLTLKDALPGNIVFNNSYPVFVDFTSLVHKDRLGKEEWLAAGAKRSDLRYAVVDRMLIPFMLIPLMAMRGKKYDLARTMLSIKACNCGGGIPRWFDLYFDARAVLSPIRALKSLSKRWLAYLSGESLYFGQIAKLRGIINRRRNLDFMEFNRRIMESVAGLDVTPPRSAYLSYYENKKENFDFDDQTSWNNKQKKVYEIVSSSRPGTVLDLGANTGWFSILSAKLGANVIATDIDESSIDSLYLYSKYNGLPILPLLLSFDAMTREIYGVAFADSCYHERDFMSVPLFLPPTRRLQSDLVLCLGLIHHLLLGAGKDIKAIFEVLSQLCKNTLVLEFVDRKDNLIQKEPSFFKSLNKYSESDYNLDTVVHAGKLHFPDVQIFDSNPDTRKLLIFHK